MWKNQRKEIMCIVQDIFVGVSTNKKKFVFGLVYFSPYATSYDYQCHHIIVEDDFNLSTNIKWICDHSLVMDDTEGESKAIKDSTLIMYKGYAMLNLNQLHPNHSLKNYSLDLLFGEKI